MKTNTLSAALSGCLEDVYSYVFVWAGVSAKEGICEWWRVRKRELSKRESCRRTDKV